MPDPQNPQPTAADAGPVELHYDNLLRDTIVRATRTLNRDWCLSVFEDNAGIIAFDDEYGIAFKVETHNHPSAIEPYGGAATGVGGCVRDIMGCGLGAKPIANTDVFCIAPPDWPTARLPRGVLHPGAILDGVVAGVRDYGNRMGIPTVNGAIHFDWRYLGNPLVYVGCVGLIPRKLVHKKANPGDKIVLVGGRTGRDGIHGATFSSAELTDTHGDEFSHAVQIGNPITEKKVLDCQLQARDHPDGCLYSAVTDCGAGGLSSAVGEMGAATGARAELGRVPLKYVGLRYDEIWISEAQERMVLAAPPRNVEKLLAIFAAEDVEATVIGEFTNDKMLTVTYEGIEVGRLDMNFLHHGLPQRRREAEWTPPREAPAEKRDATPASPKSKSFGALLKQRLGDINTASREWVIRQYDHEVQGGSVIKPLCGPGDGPADATVIRPRLDSNACIAIGCGICPQMSDIDPYWMAVAAVDEALRNVVCVGGDLGHTAILDNFCWPKVDAPGALGALVRACQGAHDAAVAYGLPFISGKDSLNNEFSMPGREATRCNLPPSLAIPATLLVSAVSVIDDWQECIDSAIKRGDEETRLWYVSAGNESWGRTSLDQRIHLHLWIHKLIALKFALAAHDVGEEGIAAALAEMAIAGRHGLSLAAGADRALDYWFRPRIGGYIVQTTELDDEEVREACAERGLACELLGIPIEEQTLRLSHNGRVIEEVGLAELEHVWKTAAQR